MDVTVFYAWQDDRPSECNRYLIRDAAKQACARITNDPSNDWRVSLDEATQGVPGMCDIPNTILEKIQRSDVFLVDLTFVGSTDTEGEAQLISNPNVLFELGYAVGILDFDHILDVMNVAYGQPERQMFDVKRRWGIRYDLPENSGKSGLRIGRENLSRDIEAALLTILDKAVLPDKAEKASERFARIRAEFESSVRDGSFHDLEREGGTIAVTLVPSAGATFEHQDLQNIELLSPNLSGCRSETYGRSRVWIYEETDRLSDRKGRRVRCSVAEISLEGVIRAADALCLHPGMRPERIAQSRELGNTIPSGSFERVIVDSVLKYGNSLHRLGCSLPWRLGVSLLDVRGYRMYAGSPYMGRSIEHTDDIMPAPIVIANWEDMYDGQAVGRLLKDAFDYIWRECGFAHSLNYDAEDNWKGPFWR